MVELGRLQPGCCATRGNDYDTLYVAIHHATRFSELVVRILVRSGDYNGVAMLFGHDAYGVGAVGEERVEEVGN
jgi:hypothetical protein